MRAHPSSPILLTSETKPNAVLKKIKFRVVEMFNAQLAWQIICFLNRIVTAYNISTEKRALGITAVSVNWLSTGGCCNRDHLCKSFQNGDTGCNYCRFVGVLASCLY